MKPDKRTEAEKFRSLLSRIVRVSKLEVEDNERERQRKKKTRERAVETRSR